MKKLAALLLALCMLFSLTACGQSAEPASEPVASAPESTAEAVSEPSEEASEAPVSPASAEEEEASLMESFVEETPVVLEPLEYPVSDGSTTLTYWYSYPPFVPNFLDDVSNKEIYLAIGEATGVNTRWWGTPG